VKNILITIDFHSSIHSIREQVTDEDWSNPEFRIKLKNRLECNPTVLRMIESDEPDYRQLLKEMTADRDQWKRNCADLTKKLNAATVGSGAGFAVV